MHPHPTLVAALQQERCAELRRTAAAANLSRRAARRPLLESTQRRCGWLLIDIGLRLAVPRPAVSWPAIRRPRARSL